MAIVVLLLFAIGVAGALGYEMVRTEASMSFTDQEGGQAFTAAEAGLERFMAEPRDSVPASATYTVLNAGAAVTSREVMDGPYPNKRYLIKSVGTMVDQRFSGNASERTVYQLADFKRSPVSLFAALMSPSENITLNKVDDVDGHDEATSSDCADGGVEDLHGVLGGGNVHIQGGGVSGSGGPSESFTGASAVMDSLGVDWSALTNPDFPVDFENRSPGFFFFVFHPDSFPVVRYDGDQTVDWRDSGQGALIVGGKLSFNERFGRKFTWHGLILANSIDNNTNDDFDIRGALVVGLDGSGDSFKIENHGTIKFNSCYVIDAGRELAHLEPLAGTWWEEF